MCINLMYTSIMGINLIEILYDKAGVCHSYARFPSCFWQANHKIVLLWRAWAIIFDGYFRMPVANN